MSEDKIELASETMTGDIRDFLLSHLRDMQKPWAQMSQAEQKAKVELAEKAAENLVKNALETVAGRGLPFMVITVGKFTCDGAEMKGTYSAYASDENLLRARHLSERRALFVLADPDLYFGERHEAKTDPDEPGLPLPGDDDEDLPHVGSTVDRRQPVDA